MNQIPNIQDKIQALYIYLENNQSDEEGDSWYYLHNPNIVSHINNFSKIECEKLMTEIWKWDEKTFYHLADPFINISNSNLDGYYIYGQIFLKVSNIEATEYLVENTQIVHNIPKGTYPIDFYIDLDNKINSLNERSYGYYGYWVEQIKSKVAFEKGISLK